MRLLCIKVLYVTFTTPKNNSVLYVTERNGGSTWRSPAPKPWRVVALTFGGKVAPIFQPRVMQRREVHGPIEVRLKTRFFLVLSAATLLCVCLFFSLVKPLRANVSAVLKVNQPESGWGITWKFMVIFSTQLHRTPRQFALLQ